MEENIAGTTALVTDVDRRKAMPIIQALGREGVRVIGISYKPLPLGSFSKYCAHVYRVPDYRSEPNLFLEELERLCSIEKPDVFYPIEDEVIILCSKHRSRWSPYTKALISENPALEAAYDKWQTITAARKLSIPVPNTFCPTSTDEVSLIAAGWQGEAVIKPRRSSGSRGIVYADKPESILPAYRIVAEQYHQPLVQERIPSEGNGLGVFALINSDHQVAAVFGHKRIREFPVSGGPSTLCMSYRDEDLLQKSIALLTEIGMVGVAMVEYKIDVRTGVPVLMEINPRFWGSLQLAIYAGVNFPVLYHKAAMGLPFDPIIDYQLNKFWRWLIPGDILHFLSNPNRFKLKPSFFSLDRRNTSYDFSTDDLFPIVGILITAILKLFSGDK